MISLPATGALCERQLGRVGCRELCLGEMGPEGSVTSELLSGTMGRSPLPARARSLPGKSRCPQADVAAATVLPGPRQMEVSHVLRRIEISQLQSLSPLSQGPRGQPVPPVLPPPVCRHTARSCPNGGASRVPAAASASRCGAKGSDPPTWAAPPAGPGGCWGRPSPWRLPPRAPG